MDIYKEFNIKTVINAQSWVTKLGGSIMSREVLDAMNKASSAFVDVEELHEKCSEQIANLCDSESALITSGCASAIVLMSAAAICAKDESLLDEIPNLLKRKEILIHASHRNHYDSALEMTGAKLIEYKNIDDIRRKFTKESVAIAFVEAPFIGIGLGIDETVKIGNEFNLPVLVDASARIPPVNNLFKFINAGASMVSYSGGKGIRGPQNTGFILGKKSYIDLAKRNLICFSDTKAKIGRSMKVSKECLVGLVVALKLFLDINQEEIWDGWKEKAKFIVKELSNIEDLDVKLEDDGLNREGPQAVIYFNNNWKGLSPNEIRLLLEKGDPPIYVGTGGYKDEINLAMTNIQDGQEKIIVEKLKDILIK
ncbi:MAG: hypothetical protein CL906_00835 [Dehalococcoidia bacterium]|nr:hypothetical protein [Dehalococcoidia bacterium]|tara:strand:+ start:4308 stop:5411 length:1104 start_codon:yes stop_codon:yes gene_type:complete